LPVWFDKKNLPVIGFTRVYKYLFFLFDISETV